MLIANSSPAALKLVLGLAIKLSLCAIVESSMKIDFEMA
jgi:hypothetical protein